MVEPYSFRLNRLHNPEPKSQYGLQASTSIRSQLRSQTRSEARKDPSTPHSDHLNTNSSSRLRLLHKKDSSVSSQRLNQQLQSTYRNHIQSLISQNESLKLQQRQAQVRADELQQRLVRLESGAMGMGMSRTASQTNLRQQVSPLKVIFKYQLPIRKALEQFGYTRDEASIQHCNNEAEIIEFLIGVIGTRALAIKDVERESREKVVEEQREIGRVRESLKKLMETNQLFRNREKRYKEKMEETRRQWQKANQELAQKDKQFELLESQKQAIQKVAEQQDMQIARLQREIRSNLETHKSSAQQISEQILVVKNQLRETQHQNQILKHSLEQAQQTIQNLKIKEKMKEDQLSRTQRDASKWKQRYEKCQKQSAERKQIQQIQQPVSNKQQWRYHLQPIPEITNSSVQVSRSQQQFFSSSRLNLQRPFSIPPNLPEFESKPPPPQSSLPDLEQQVARLYKTVLMEVEERNKITAQKL